MTQRIFLGIQLNHKWSIKYNFHRKMSVVFDEQNIIITTTTTNPTEYAVSSPSSDGYSIVGQKMNKVKCSQVGLPESQVP